MAWRDHGCEYEHDGSQCPKLGIYTTSLKCDGKERWYCAYHHDPANRGHEYADGQMVRAIAEEVGAGRQSRGSAMVARETDALVDVGVARLGLSRGAGEAKVDFVARCRAQMLDRGVQRLSGGLSITAEERRLLLEAGEDPDVGLEVAE